MVSKYSVIISDSVVVSSDVSEDSGVISDGTTPVVSSVEVSVTVVDSENPEVICGAAVVSDETSVVVSKYSVIICDTVVVPSSDVSEDPEAISDGVVPVARSVVDSETNPVAI